MKKLFSFLSTFLIISAILITGCSKESPINSSQSANNIVPDTYIITLNISNGNNIQSVEGMHSAVVSFLNVHGIAMDKVGHIYESVLVGFSAELTNDQLAALSKDPAVKLIEKDQIITINDKVETINEPVQKGKNNVLVQTTPWGITSVGGPSTSTNFGIAWIVDTGINLSHPDLNVYSARCTTFVRTGNDSRTAEDGNGHGTHVAGIIAAKSNTIGVVGVAPNARVVGVKCLNSQGSGSISDIVAALNYVYRYSTNGDVVNMSLGGGASTTLDNAVGQFATRNNAGTIIVRVCVAAGNSSANAGNYSPARVNGTGIYTVSAYDINGAFAYFSNYGNPPIDISAPGVNIYSCYKNGGYATMSGTSMATPHVCGVILARAGAPATSGTVTNDPDGTADPKAHI